MLTADRFLTSLEQSSDALAAANAHGFQAVLNVFGFHLVEQSGQNTGARGCDGMAQRDTRAVDVEVVFVWEFPLSEHR